MRVRWIGRVLVALIAGAGLLALTVPIGGCGSDVPAGPAVSVDWITGSSPDGAVALLKPSGSPACSFAFKVVHDGRAKTLASYDAQPMIGTGSVAVRSGRSAIDAFWVSPTGGGGQPSVHVDVPRGLRYSSSSWSGSRHPADGAELTIWAQEWIDGRLPSGGGLPMGEFSDLLAESLKRPRLVIYCITLEVKADTSPR